MVACNDRSRRVNRGFTRFDAALPIMQAVPAPLHRHFAPTRAPIRPLHAIVALTLAVPRACVTAQDGARLPNYRSSAGTGQTGRPSGEDRLGQYGYITG